MLNKLLFKGQNKVQLIIAIVGSLLGFTFLITSIHYLIKVNEFGEGAEILGSNTLIVQRKIGPQHTLGIGKTTFSQKDIDEMNALNYVDAIHPVKNNRFDIFFETNSDLVPHFSSVVFVQSLNQEFLKIDSDKWNWSPDDSIVPIIMPRDLVVMLNTFATSQGIPPISDDLIMDVKFKFTISNKDKKEYRDVRIIGFTNEVSTILVPEEFMEYGNETYPNGKEKEATQLMVTVQENEFGQFDKFMQARSLESKESAVIVGQLKSMVATLFSIVLGISIIAVFLSGLVLIQYSQLLITNNKYQTQTLLRIGYSPKLIINKLSRYFISVFAIIVGISVVVFVLGKYFIDGQLEDGGLYVGNDYTWTSFSSIILALLIFSAICYFSVKKAISNTK